MVMVGLAEGLTVTVVKDPAAGVVAPTVPLRGPEKPPAVRMFVVAW
jgi:hypothetical protein